MKYFLGCRNHYECKQKDSNTPICNADGRCIRGLMYPNSLMDLRFMINATPVSGCRNHHDCIWMDPNKPFCSILSIYHYNNADGMCIRGMS